MSTALPSVSVQSGQSSARAATKVPSAARWFYPLCGVVLLVLTLVGFRLFYFNGQAFPGRPLTPPIRGIVILHGVVMSLWIVLFAVQPMLVAAGRRRLHMMLGRAGAVLAGAVLITGMMVAVSAARANPPELKIFGLTPRPFLTVPFFAVLLFAGCVAAAVWQRRRPEVHRALMFTGTMAAMSAAMGRMEGFNAMVAGTVLDTVLGAFATTQIVMAVLVLVRCIMLRAVDRWLVIGFVGLTAAFALVVQIAHTSAWMWFATQLVP